MATSGENMDLVDHNRAAWDRMSSEGIAWGEPVSSNEIERARQGTWQISLAGEPIPRDWMGNVAGQDILCLASGGGQQAPVLAAAGAAVTCLDLSPVQLEKDKLLAERHQLSLRIEQGTMTDLSRFDDDSFHMVLLPVAVNNIPDPQPVWDECFRVIQSQGLLLAGFINPLVFLFEENDGSSSGRGLTVENRLPYEEYGSLSERERAQAVERKTVLQWSHTLDTLIGGQLRAGFRITGFVECHRSDKRAPTINRFSSTYFSTRAVKPTAV